MKTCLTCLESMKSYGILPTRCIECGADRTGSSSEDFFQIAAEMKHYRSEVREPSV